jgi:16S rRNA processing protein RimM
VPGRPPGIFFFSKIYVDKRGSYEPYEVESLRIDRNSPHLKLRGVDSLAAADGLAGLDVCVPEEALAPPGDGSYYDFQIIGSEVVAKDGGSIGTVKGLLPVGDRNILVVDRGGREVLIPFVESLCLDVDAAAKRIRVDLPDGLLDLNDI